jgi:hypothetical protein
MNDNKLTTADVTPPQEPAQPQSRFESILKAATAVVAIITLVAAILQYRATANTDFRRVFWEQQLAIYKTATSAAGKIASATNINDVMEARNSFWALYWGEVSILEHPVVKRAMEAYGDQLKRVEAGEAPPSSLKQLSYALARACRLSLKETWNPVDIGDIPDISVGK